MGSGRSNRGAAMNLATYVLRRLLLMVPTLFGITIVAFLMMQLAPGDPLLHQGDTGQGEEATSRETYLIQKRALGLDKPILLNFNGFRDYGPPLTAAAYFLGRPEREIAGELPELARAADDSPLGLRRRYLAGLGIPDFE